jgi:hypothetical protein
VSQLQTPPAAGNPLRERYYMPADYEDAKRTVTAGIWLLVASIVFGALTAIPAFVVGAIAVSKRRQLAGSLIMCAAPIAAVLPLLAAIAIGFGPSLDDDTEFADPFSTPTPSAAYQECLRDPNTIDSADCDHLAP